MYIHFKLFSKQNITYILLLSFLLFNCGFGDLLTQTETEKITNVLVNQDGKWKHQKTVHYEIVKISRGIYDSIPVDTIISTVVYYQFNNDKGDANYRSGNKIYVDQKEDAFEWDVDQFGTVELGKQRLELYFPIGASPNRIEKYTMRYWDDYNLQLEFQDPNSSDPLKYEIQFWQKN